VRRRAIVGCCFILISLADYKYFVFYPLQQNIKLEEEKERKKSTESLTNDAHYSENAYKVLYQANSRFWRDHRYTVSYKKVFLMEEVLIIILTGSIRLGAE